MCGFRSYTHTYTHTLEFYDTIYKYLYTQIYFVFFSLVTTVWLFIKFKTVNVVSTLQI